jgi:hypothetical protein
MTLAPWVFDVSYYQVGKQPMTLLYHAGASCCQLVCLLMAQAELIACKERQIRAPRLIIMAVVRSCRHFSAAVILVLACWLLSFLHRSRG